MTNYELGEIIDSGGMGVVYKGRHVTLERDVAIKFILPQVASDEAAVERFLREARLAARINHPNVVHVYDTGVDSQGRPYIVMELLTGEPLKQRLSRGPMMETETVEIGKQVLMALEKAHAMGVIHRDIKPGNIFLCGDRTVKILDFGVAKGLDAGNVTLAGKTVGSPAYMSPEQAEGATVDHRTDLYSVGIVMYEMLTGVTPFRGDNSFAIMQQHLSSSPPSLPGEVNGVLRSVIEKSLAKKPDKRYANAADMRAALDKAQPKAAIVAKPTAASGTAGTATPSPGSKSKPTQDGAPAAKGKSGLIVAAIAGIALIGAGAIFVPKMLGGSAPPATTGTTSGGQSGSTTGSSTGSNTGTTTTSTSGSESSGSTSTTSGSTGSTTSTSSGNSGSTSTTSSSGGETTSTGSSSQTSGATTGGTSGVETPKRTTKMSTVTEVIEPTQKRIDDPSMPKGQTKVVTPGVKGETETTYEETYEGDKLVGRKQVSERVSKPPVDEVVKVGTGPANGGENPGGAITKQTVERTETIGFSTSTVRDSSLSPGQRVTRTEGRAGSRLVKYELTMKDGKVVDRKVLSRTVTRPPVNRVVAVGPPKPQVDPVRPRPWHCPSCGKSLSGSQQFCPDDGTRRPGG